MCPLLAGVPPQRPAGAFRRGRAEELCVCGPVSGRRSGDSAGRRHRPRPAGLPPHPSVLLQWHALDWCAPIWLIIYYALSHLITQLMSAHMIRNYRASLQSWTCHYLGLAGNGCCFEAQTKCRCYIGCKCKSRETGKLYSRCCLTYLVLKDWKTCNNNNN